MSDNLRETDSSRTIRNAVAFISAWLPYSLLAYRFWYNNDDAFITFRYARNWALGHGVRYNPGTEPPEEGYSNFLWVTLCAVVEYLGGDVTFWAPTLGFVCGSALLYWVFRTLRHDLGMDRSVAFMVTLSLGLFPPYALWSTGGMATMAFALAFFAAFYFLVLRSGDIALFRGAAAGVALSLLRFEGIAWALLIALVTLVSRRMRGQNDWRPLAIYVAIVGTAFSCYFAWRYSYYELLFPNPVYSKVGFNPEVALRGFRYLVTFVLTFLTPLLVLPAAYVAWRKAPKPLAVGLIFMTFGVAAFAVVVGGDWMPMGRFLVPGFAFGALLLGFLVARHWEGSSRRVFVCAAVLTTILVGIVPAWNIQLAPASVRRPFHFRYFGAGFRTEYEVWRDGLPNLADRKEVALALKEHLEPGDSIVAGAIGVLGYYSDLHISDRYGLVDRRVATRPHRTSHLRSPGHDSKVSINFFLSDEPTILLHERVSGPPPSRKNPEYPLRRRVKTKAESWNKMAVWRRYVPELLPLEPLPEGSPSVLLILRLIEEEPTRIAELPRAKRRAARAKRARVIWNDFFNALDSTLP